MVDHIQLMLSKPKFYNSKSSRCFRTNSNSPSNFLQKLYKRSSNIQLSLVQKALVYEQNLISLERIYAPLFELSYVDQFVCSFLELKLLGKELKRKLSSLFFSNKIDFSIFEPLPFSNKSLFPLKFEL